MKNRFTELGQRLAAVRVENKEKALQTELQAKREAEANEDERRRWGAVIDAVLQELHTAVFPDALYRSGAIGGSPEDDHGENSIVAGPFISVSIVSGERGKPEGFRCSVFQTVVECRLSEEELVRTLQTLMSKQMDEVARR